MTSGVRRDLSGQKFGRLQVIEIAGRKSTPNGCVRLMWRCTCDCGVDVVVQAAALTKGTTKSCGCLQREATGDRARTHGMSNTPTYESWRGMTERCSNPNNSHYKDYGGRGITVDRAMTTFDGFLSVMGIRPNGHTLERKLINENYSPSNCIWLPSAEQQHNTSRSWRIEIRGETKSLKQWCDRLSIPYARVKGRLRIGWETWKALELSEPAAITNIYKLPH